MTVGAATWPNYMGGGTHGGNWSSLAQAQSSAAQATNLAYMGAAAGTTASRPDTGTVEDAGIRAGEIIGWRAWYVRGGLLVSMAVAAKWIPGQPMTGDPKTSGVHAFKERKRVLYTYGNIGIIVIGRVALWGEVIEHEMGYRAEFGQVESLDEIRGGTQDQLDALRALYINTSTSTSDNGSGAQ